MQCLESSVEVPVISVKPEFVIIILDHEFSTFAKFSEKLTFQRNKSFSEHFTSVLNGGSLLHQFINILVHK